MNYGEEYEEKVILKSDKLIKLSKNSEIVALGAVAFGFVSLLSLVIVSAVYNAPVEGLKNEAKVSPTYIQYVQDKTNEYNEELNVNEITPDEYIAKVNDLSDIDAYLKNHATEYEMAKYSELVESRDTAKYIVGGIGLGFCGTSVLAIGCMVGMGYAYKNKEKEKGWQEELMMDE